MKSALFITVSLFLASCTEISSSKKLIEACADFKTIKHLDSQIDLAIVMYRAGESTLEAAEYYSNLIRDKKIELRDMPFKNKFKGTGLTNYPDHYDECEYQYRNSPKNFKEKWE